MKEVFIVMYRYSEYGYNASTGIVEIFSNENSANTEARNLNKKYEDYEDTTYFVKSYAVKD